MQNGGDEESGGEGRAQGLRLWLSRRENEEVAADRRGVGSARKPAPRIRHGRHDQFNGARQLPGGVAPAQTEAHCAQREVG